MKTLFIEGRWQGCVRLPSVDELPKKILLVSSVQFLDCLADIREQLEATGRTVIMPKLRHCAHPGQVLGCSLHKIDADFDAALYIGDGQFHPTALLKNKRPVYALNPFTSELKQVDNDWDRKEIGAYKKFLTVDDIGVLISTKIGQDRSSLMVQIEKRFPTKNFHKLLFDTLDMAQLNNFPFIDCFINCACPRIALDDDLPKPVIDIETLTAFLDS